MKRRAFLSSLGFGTVAAAAAAIGWVDVERLLWMPGERTIVLPPVRRRLHYVIQPLTFRPLTGRLILVSSGQ